MTNPKISVIVPVYNVERYIRECFSSIAAQAYCGKLECIFVDDCGQDKSVGILEKQIAAYQGNIDFRLVHHEHNKGLSGARNTGIRNATGEYLYFLDSDDSITPDCLERLAELAMKYHGVEVVQGSAKTADNWMLIKKTVAPEYSGNFAWIRKTLLKRILPMTAWNKLIDRKFVLAHELYFVDGMIHEDEIWNFMLSKYVHSIAFCFEPTYNYRDNDSGIMSKMKHNKDRYLPIVDYMSHHTSVPYLSSELECMVHMLEDGDNVGLIDEYLKNVPCSMSLMKWVLNMKYRVNHTTKRTPIGIVWRIAYWAGARWMDWRYNSK